MYVISVMVYDMSGRHVDMLACWHVRTRSLHRLLPLTLGELL